jgi:hypothetical protein
MANRIIAENLVEERFVLACAEHKVANSNFETTRIVQQSAIANFETTRIEQQSTIANFEKTRIEQQSAIATANMAFEHASCVLAIAEDNYVSALEKKEIFDKAAALVHDIISNVEAVQDVADSDMPDVSIVPVYPIFNNRGSSEVDIEQDIVNNGDDGGIGNKILPCAGGIDNDDNHDNVISNIDKQPVLNRQRRIFPSWRTLYNMCCMDSSVMSILRDHIPSDTDMKFIKKISNGPRGNDLQMSESKLNGYTKPGIKLLIKFRFILTDIETGLFVNTMGSRTWTRRSIGLP